jgi:hypothetical protein
MPGSKATPFAVAGPTAPDTLSSGLEELEAGEEKLLMRVRDTP